jgi:hypothetical protein
VAGKEGTSRNASLTKMKSMRDGNEVEERLEMVPSGTVEINPWSSSQVSRDAAQGEVRFPPGDQVSEWVLKLPLRSIGDETSKEQSSR